MNKKSDAREAMLGAAVELFRARGYEGVGVAELLEVSGAPRGSLYFHFPGGKEQIGVEVVNRVGAAVTALFAKLGASEVDLDTYVDVVFKYTAREVEERAFDACCPIAAIAGDTSSRIADLRDAVAATFADWEREIARGVEQRGLSEQSAARFASAMVTMIEGAYLVSKSNRSLAPHENAALAMKALGAQMLALDPVRH